jgi:hypothetical protein
VGEVLAQDDTPSVDLVEERVVPSQFSINV